MVRFGETYLLQNTLSWKGKLGFFIYGIPHIGSFMRYCYIKKYLTTARLGESVLDAGCGGGDYVLYLAKKYKSIKKIKGLDFDENIIKKNQETIRGIPIIEFQTQDLLTLNAKNEYDCILSVDCLEHIRNNKKVLENFFSALKNNGTVIIHMPLKKEEDTYILNEKYFKKFHDFEEKEHVGEFYNPEQLKNLMQSIGFRNIEYTRTVGYMGKLTWEISQLLLERKQYFFRTILILPLKALCVLDAVFSHKKGYGILIKAQKVLRESK